MSEERRRERVETKHWSLHKWITSYELLAQIRPTDAFDALILHDLGDRVTQLLRSVAVADGFVPSGPAIIRVVWFRSEWRADEDGSSVAVTKVETDDLAEADDVMLVVTLPLTPPGGVR